MSPDREASDVREIGKIRSSGKLAPGIPSKPGMVTSGGAAPGRTVAIPLLGRGIAGRRTQGLVAVAVSGEVANDAGFTRVRLKVAGPPLDVTISPAFPIGTEMRVERGSSSSQQAEETVADFHVTIRTGSTNATELTL